VSVVYYNVEVSATSSSLVQRIPTDCVASTVCDLENKNLVNEEAIAREIGLQRKKKTHHTTYSTMRDA